MLPSAFEIVVLLRDVSPSRIFVSLELSDQITITFGKCTLGKSNTTYTNNQYSLFHKKFR